ncbi:extracellular solute-binding protein [Vibrio renipiscarius]|uniref:ABC transporter substrate-binding protein n=1 Tax=Vibrio renipiscarius TaxID=1461322 RepID=A0A0C2NG29_9VIBR|nr:extracellular solute-binding protein [Vibrio renipiscarius]KII75320.1 ABC transporter substrate-binding protein [Vibrio renipiscarius]KII78772.1 ABC transporter substrate-binding protein [Vibrio renipiscarius]
MKQATLAVSLSILSASSLAAPTELKIWRHQTGDIEMQASAAMVERFNQSQGQWNVVVESIPEGAYNESITAAAMANQLPCAMTIDQPTVPNFAWSGFIQPLDKLLDKKDYDTVLAGGKGTYKGQLYSLGQFDVALVMFSRYSTLEKHAIRVPTVDKPWNEKEFADALAKLKTSGDFNYPLDLNAAWGGEWPSYGWGPMLQSFGGDLIDRDNYVYADEVLNGDDSIAFAKWFKNLVDNNYIDKKPANDKGFVSGRVAMHYTGSWSAENYFDAFGEDLAILPPPDLGNGPVISGGSWQWSVTKACPHPEGAAEFISFIMQPEEIAQFVDQTSLVPTKPEAAKLSKLYKEAGQWNMFYVFASLYGQTRPATPGYPVISTSFDKAMRDIIDGKDPLDALDMAVDTIELNIEANKGYGFKL